MFRNYRKELDAAGWQTLWEGKGPKDLGFWFPYHWDDIGDGESFNQYFAYSPDAMHYWAGKLEKPDGVYHATLVVTQFQDGATKVALEKGQVIAQLNTVRVGGMDEKMVAMKADQMESSIKSAGRVALYGILFDFNKADSNAPTDKSTQSRWSPPRLWRKLASFSKASPHSNCSSPATRTTWAGLNSTAISPPGGQKRWLRR